MHPFIKAVYNSRFARKLYRTPFGRFIYHLPEEIVDLFRKNKPLRPPLWMMYTGRGDFEQVGKEFLNHFITLGGLKPNHKVMDVGSGIGRMAVPLTKYLNKEGQYIGFEVVKTGVKWCKKRISSNYPNFQFVHANVYNELYNKHGRIKAEEYRFPSDNNSCDFVFLTSVFTHMGPDAVSHYMQEISRVLKPGGRCFITWSCVDGLNRQLVAQGASMLKFEIDEKRFWHPLNPKRPNDDIAYNEEWIRELYQKNGLKIIEPILFGCWSGRKEYFSTQDVIVAEKA